MIEEIPPPTSPHWAMQPGWAYRYVGDRADLWYLVIEKMGDNHVTLVFSSPSHGHGGGRYSAWSRNYAQEKPWYRRPFNDEDKLAIVKYRMEEALQGGGK